MSSLRDAWRDWWDLLDEGSYFKTDKIDTFLAFLRSKGTTSCEINCMDGLELGLTAHGPTGSVIFEIHILKISKVKKRELVETVEFTETSQAKIPRNRISEALRGYFFEYL